MQKGIDIYSLNLDDAQAPSWADIRQADFVFVFIKASEWREDDGTVFNSNGTINQALTPAHLAYGFANRWPALKTNGLLRGCFHLPRPNTDQGYVKIDAQLDTFLRQCPRLIPGDFGPVLDMEDRKLYNDTDPAHNASYWVPAAQRLLAGMETALGRQPIIYTQRSWWRGYMNDAMGFDHYLLWVVDVNHPTAPVLPSSWNTWSWWQWHWEQSTTQMPPPFRNPKDKGVDLDNFNGTMYELRGTADIGRPSVAFVSGSVSVAHSELDDHLHLLTNDGSTWTDTDLGQGDLPGGGADPVLLESGGARFLYFRSGDAVIEAKSNGASSWETIDLTEISSAKPIHDPRAVMDGDKHHVVFWAEDDDWYLLTCDNGWISVGVLRDANLGTATGQPLVFVQSGLPHVAGRIDSDGHLWDVWPDLAGGWKKDDVTALALANDPGTPAATYSPCAYETSAGVALAFRAVGGEMWVIDRTSNTPTNLGAAASAVRSLGHPTCFVLNDIPHVIYRGIDGIVYDLFPDASGGWQAQSICHDKMAADPVAATDGTNAAVAVRAPDGVIHVAVFDGSAWACNPTTMATPPSPGTPAPDNGGDDKSVG